MAYQTTKVKWSCINICLCPCEWLIYTVLLLFWNVAGHSSLFLNRFNKTSRSFLLNANNFAYVYMSRAHDVRVVSGRWLLIKSSLPNENFAFGHPLQSKCQRLKVWDYPQLSFTIRENGERWSYRRRNGNRGRAVIMFLKVWGYINIHRGTCPHMNYGMNRGNYPWRNQDCIVRGQEFPWGAKGVSRSVLYTQPHPTVNRDLQNS